MSSEWKDAPSKQEKQREIERILASEMFAKKPTLARLLKRIVKSDFDGNTIDERTLGIDVFGRKKDWITLSDGIVRENLRLLRKQLKEYYRTDGSEDRVRISLPAYRVVFSYSHESLAYRQCLLGYHLLSKGDPIRAERFFLAAIKSGPDHAPGYAGLADCRLLTCFLFGYHAYSDLAVDAEGLANTALKLNPELWQAHTALGAIFIFRRCWKKAAAAFEKARQINTREVEESPWHLMFLFAMGFGDQAVRIAESKVMANTDDATAHGVFALCLYLRGRFFEAERTLTMLELVEQPDSIALVCRACLKLAAGQGKEALELIDQIDVIVRHFPLIRGLLTLSLGWAEKKGQARKEFVKLKNSKKHSLGLALAQMGIGDGPDAVTTLRKACKDCEVTMILIHTLPMLAPLGTLKRFRSLIDAYKPFGKRG